MLRGDLETTPILVEQKSRLKKLYFSDPTIYAPAQVWKNQHKTWECGALLNQVISSNLGLLTMKFCNPLCHSEIGNEREEASYHYENCFPDVKQNINRIEKVYF